MRASGNNKLAGAVPGTGAHKEFEPYVLLRELKWVLFVVRLTIVINVLTEPRRVSLPSSRTVFKHMSLLRLLVCIFKLILNTLFI